MTRWTAFLLAAIAGATAIPCQAQDALQRPLIFPDQGHLEIFEQQDKKHRRIQAQNLRAQRSICEDGCRVKGGPRFSQPTNPFAALPNWEDEAAPGLQAVDAAGE